MLSPSLLTNRAGQPFEFRSDRRKFFIARFAKGGYDFFVRRAFDRGGLKHDCFAGGRFDLLL